jgi:hypothetical protein
MAIVMDEQPVPMLGMRAFEAPLAKDRPASKVPAKRTEEDLARLLERAKPLMAEAVAWARDAGRPLRDVCVLMDAKVKVGEREGVVMTRELVEKIFTSKAEDRFDVRGRFEEPRPESEFLLLVKHADGMEEIHVSLEGVTRVPEAKA